MAEFFPVVAVLLPYMGLLLLLALWVERTPRGRRMVSSPLVYALSLAVYGTAWTFFGSVGFAVRHGLLFVAVHLGPTLALILGWPLLRKLIAVRDRFGVTSLADLVSSRYRKSQGLAAFVSAMLSLGLLPYVALQLQAITRSVAVLSRDGWSSGNVGTGVELVIAFSLIGFVIAFGLRRLSPAERHPGIVAVLAAGSVVKLTAMLGTGAGVTWGLFDGMDELFGCIDQAHGCLSDEKLLPSGPTWFGYLAASAIAIFALPRQFHTAVVENRDLRHVRTACWVLPLFLLAIDLFVLPIALAGVALGLPPTEADAFVLTIPWTTGHRALSWLVLLGGFSAASGMVVAETVALANMVSNHLVLPIVEAVEPLRPLRKHVLAARWVVATAFVLAGSFFGRAFGTLFDLVGFGLISFVAVAQLAPPILFGLYWRGASKAGAAVGLGVGFGVWCYTLLLPVFVRAGWLSTQLLEPGPFGISWLRADMLFGLEGLASISHGLLWSLMANAGLLVLVSLLFPPDEREARLASEVVGVLEPPTKPAPGPEGPALFEVGPKWRKAQALLAEYFGEAQAQERVERCAQRAGIPREGRIPALALVQLEAAVERELAGSVGAGVAHAALGRAGLFSPAEQLELSRSYAALLAGLRVPPAELRRRVDYYREREALLAREVERSRRVADVSRALASSLDYQKTVETLARFPLPWLADATLLHLPGAEEPRVTFVRAASEGEVSGGIIDLRGRHIGLHPTLRRVLETGQLELRRSDSPAAWPFEGRDLTFAASLTLLLQARGRRLGTLTLFMNERQAGELPGELALVQDLAGRGAVALDNALLLHATREALRAREEFLAAVSHELKTPLTPLLLKVQTLKRALGASSPGAEGTQRLVRLLETSEMQLRELDNLVERLIDVTQALGGQLPLHLEETDMAAVVGQAVARYRLALQRANCTLTLSLQPVPGRFDKLQLERLAGYLLDNVVKHARNSPVEVSTSTQLGWATLVVQDRGPGIAPEAQARLFAPFERGTSYLEIRGLGLGLFAARAITMAHGGTLEVESAPGAGARFTARFPLALREEGR